MKNKLILWLFFLITTVITSSFSSEPLPDSGGIGVSRLHHCTPTGTVSAYAGEVAPDGWLICNGQIVSRGDYRSLYETIGRTYTSASFSPPLDDNLFCLPDLRGRVIVCVDRAAGRVTAHNTLGASGGEEKHRLTVDELASHSHSFRTSYNGPASGILSKDQSIPSSVETLATDLSGGDSPHNNMQPYLVLNYIIKH